MTDTYIPQTGDYFFAESKISSPKYYVKMTAKESYNMDIIGLYRHVHTIEDRPILLNPYGHFDSDYYFTKLPAPHNPEHLSDEQIGRADGWRLLDKDEIKDGPNIKEIESWIKNYWDQDEAGYFGNVVDITYRTKLTRPELQTLRDPSDKPNTQMNTTKLKNLDFFSVSSGLLAIAITQWLKEKGYVLSCFLQIESLVTSDKIFSIKSHSDNSLHFYNYSKQPIHFNTFSEFLAFYNKPDLPEIPQFGTYQVTVGNSYITVGCTKVTWSEYDAITYAIQKHREALESLDITDIPF